MTQEKSSSLNANQECGIVADNPTKPSQILGLSRYRMRPPSTRRTNAAMEVISPLDLNRRGRACRTAFVSVPAQFIVPTHAKPRPNIRLRQYAVRVFVVSLPPTEAILPNGHHPPHAACQGLSHTAPV